MPKNKPYEVIEHTADIGIRVKAKDLKSLFANAAAAVFRLIAENKVVTPGAPKKIRINQSAGDLDELFVNWLNELLSLSSAKNLIFRKFQIKKIQETSLVADISGNKADYFEINKEIKAATYHQLKIKKGRSGWQAEVIFDV